MAFYHPFKEAYRARIQI